ncbi:MAG: hypothetical protein ACXVP3_01095 [Actinomycetota bacterium]
MSSERPLDLRALSAVDEPEVVRQALRTFRRRILTRYVWLVVAVVLAFAVLRWSQAPSTLAERIEHAPRGVVAHPVWHAAGATISLDSVADLGDGRLGFHFVVIAKGTASLRMTGQVASELDFPFDHYIEIERAPGYPTLTVLAGGRRATVSFAPGSGIPAAVWRL